jgi:hypothetical protein
MLGVLAEGDFVQTIDGFVQTNGRFVETEGRSAFAIGRFTPAIGRSRQKEGGLLQKEDDLGLQSQGLRAKCAGTRSKSGSSRLAIARYAPAAVDRALAFDVYSLKPISSTLPATSSAVSVFRRTDSVADLAPSGRCRPLQHGAAAPEPRASGSYSRLGFNAR